MEPITRVTIKIDDDDKEKIREIANKKDLSMSQVIREAIRKYLSSEEQ